MTALKSIWAFIKGPFTEVPAMPEDLIQSGITDSAAQAAALSAAASAATAVPLAASQVALAPPPQVVTKAVDDTPAPDLIETLETILKALGHELPVFWDEVVALARKVS